MWKVVFENDYIVIGEKDPEYSPVPLDRVKTFDDLFHHYILVIGHKDNHGKIKEFYGTHTTGYSVRFLASPDEEIPPAFRRFLEVFEGKYLQKNPILFSNTKITLSDGRKYWTIIVENAHLGMVEEFIRTYEKAEWNENPDKLVEDVSPYFELLECVDKIKDRLPIWEIRLK
jgi:hypothetical protein